MTEATYIVTKSQLAAAFNAWVKAYDENPEGFSCDAHEYGDRCAEELIKLIRGEK